jgi:hypothetical protein
MFVITFIEKRVSWLSGENSPSVAVHEYKGTTPSPQPHGRKTTGNPGVYIRMHPKEMSRIKEALQHKRPGEVYHDSDPINGPRNKRQVYNAKARVGQSQSNKANFSDQIFAVEELQATMPYVRLVLKQHGKVPCVILYTLEQISDIKRFCCAPVTAQSTVLGVDKTFNLSDLHVIVTVFKNLALTQRATDDHPIFCGPIFLHGNSDTDTFFLFFFSTLGWAVVASP